MDALLTSLNNRFTALENRLKAAPTPQAPSARTAALVVAASLPPTSTPLATTAPRNKAALSPATHNHDEPHYAPSPLARDCHDS